MVQRVHKLIGQDSMTPAAKERRTQKATYEAFDLDVHDDVPMPGALSLNGRTDSTQHLV